MAALHTNAVPVAARVNRPGSAPRAGIEFDGRNLADQFITFVANSEPLCYIGYGAFKTATTRRDPFLSPV